MEITLRNIGDELGPAKIVLLREPRVGLEAIVVVDNTACGPAIGGVRMAHDVTVEEVLRLARAMTLKNAAAGLAHGGGKSGIIAAPNCSTEQKERLIRSFARLIANLTDYIPGPDMGTDETCMAWVKDEIDRAVGLPHVLGGIPLDEIGATGLGLAVAAEVAAPVAGIELKSARVAVQGFGAVGQHAARFLQQRGAHLVAASDSHGAIYNPDGLDIEALIAHKLDGASVMHYANGKRVAGEALVGVDCDIWIPAARTDVLTEQNVHLLRAKLVLQGANIPATQGAEAWMHEHGILNIPDFIANAGGVICAAVEYHGGTDQQALATIAEKIHRTTAETLALAQAEKLLPRVAATHLARKRIDAAMRFRR